jgi:predicted amidohydrolase YtcJ
MAGYADLIIAGGPIFRGLREGFAEALAVAGERIVAVGTRDAVEALAGPDTQRLDLGGRVAVPAFNDAHQHLLPLGMQMGQVSLRVRTLDELLGRIRAAAQATRRGQWILGFGYDHFALDVGRHPSLDELTAAAPDHPVFARRTDGHMGVANAAALKVTGIDATTPDPPGGVIERRGGALTGLLQERAMLLVEQALPEPSDEMLIEAIERAGRHMLSQGCASVMDANIGMIAGTREIDAYRAAHAGGRLPVRVWGCLAGNPEGIADAVWQAGLRPMEGDDRLRFAAVKVFTDGSAGGLTAAMSEPYRQGGHGVLCFDDDTTHGLLSKYHRQGWQLAIHAIGDRAVEQVLSGMEAADTPDQPVAGRRHRIEHCGFLSPNQMARMAARGIEPVPQPIFMREFGDLYVVNLGEARAAAAYPMRAWLDAGQHPAASSDAPVSSTNVFRNINAMVTRATERGTVLGADQRISVAEAVHCLTYCGAYSQFAEDRKGRLLPGMLADVAVLSRNIFVDEPDPLIETEVDVVIAGGRTVFDRNSQAAA